MQDHALCLSFATVAELWAGAENAGWAQPRRDGLQAFIRTHVVLPVDEAVTMQWARIHAVVRNQVDVNDEWTAACALAQTPALAVVTGNVRRSRTIAERLPSLTIVHPEE